MKKFIFFGSFLLVGMGVSNAQTGTTVRVPGRASNVEIRETSTTKATNITCDGFFNTETCYESTNNGPAGGNQGRTNLSLRVYGTRAYSYDGVALQQIINVPPANGSATSQFVFENR